MNDRRMLSMNRRLGPQGSPAAQEGRAARQSANNYQRDDGLDAARGILNAIPLAALIWALIFVVWWALG
jgi:hypothetical protein